MRFSRPARRILSCLFCVPCFCALPSCGTFIALEDDYTQRCDELITVYRDFDSDGEGNPAEPVRVCVRPDGYVTNDIDCNDEDSAWNSHALDDECDGLDQNCDDVPDEGFFQPPCTYQEKLPSMEECDGRVVCKQRPPGEEPRTETVCEPRWFVDKDGDNYGNEEVSPVKEGTCPTSAGGLGTGFSNLGKDCDDADPKRNPAQKELCGDGIDQDCDDFPGRVFLYQSFEVKSPPIPKTPWSTTGGFEISAAGANCVVPDNKWLMALACPPTNPSGELMSPMVQTYDAKKLHLTFRYWAGSAPQGGGKAPEMIVSIKSGDVTTKVWSVEAEATDSGWSTQEDVDLSGYIGPSMSLSWSYESGDAPEWQGFAVDDIFLTDDLCEWQ